MKTSKAAETLREQPPTGCTPEPWEKLRDAASGHQPAVICSWCDRLHDPERGVHCPCRSTPLACQCGGCRASRSRRYQATVKARTDTASLDETPGAVIRKAGRAA